MEVKWSESCSVMSDSLPPQGLYSPWNSPGQNTGAGSLSLLQGIFSTQGLNPDLLPCRQILYQLSHQGSPRILEWVVYPFSSRSCQPRNRTGVSCIAGGFFTNWAIREAQIYHVFRDISPQFMTWCSPSLLRLQEVRVMSCTFGSNRQRVVVPGEIFSKHFILSSPLHLPTPTHFLFILFTLFFLSLPLHIYIYITFRTVCFFGHVACGILVPEMEHTPLALEAQSYGLSGKSLEHVLALILWSIKVVFLS